MTDPRQDLVDRLAEGLDIPAALLPSKSFHLEEAAKREEAASIMRRSLVFAMAPTADRMVREELGIAESDIRRIDYVTNVAHLRNWRKLPFKVRFTWGGEGIDMKTGAYA